MAIPMNQLLQAMEGRKPSRKDTFMEAYGEFFTPELYPHHSQLEDLYSRQDKEYDDTEDDEF